MLYLIRSFLRKGSYLKVGFTDNIDGRMKTYLHENPGRELIGIRQGSRKEETRIHLYLTACGYKAEFLDEWFLDCPEVLSGFHQSQSKMNREIWNSRSSLFTAFDFSRRSLKVEIYEDLRFQNKDRKLKEEVDLEWEKWNRKQDLINRQKLLDSGYLELINL